jgi:hypothetical protein
MTYQPRHRASLSYKPPATVGGSRRLFLCPHALKRRSSVPLLLSPLFLDPLDAAAAVSVGLYRLKTLLDQHKRSR